MDWDVNGERDFKLVYISCHGTLDSQCQNLKGRSERVRCYKTEMFTLYLKRTPVAQLAMLKQ